ncbi:MAG: tetratricopeptide repeat protein [Sandaracinaceae bacterium]|nr:tetratricopeptide repeat protein [Sandaracinaceae bacterium]
MSDDGKGKRGESTMEVEVEELKDAGSRTDSTLDRLLGELEDEVVAEPPPALAPSPKSSIPPPLPARRPSKPPSLPVKVNTPGPSAVRAAPPPRPPTLGARASAPPPPPPPTPLRKAPPRAPGMGRPASIPPASPGSPTARGIPSPEPEHKTREHIKSSQHGTLAEAAKGLAEAWIAEIAETTDPSRKARLSYEVARLFEGPLQDPKKALQHFEACLELSKDHVPSLRGARRAALATGNHRGALPYFDAEARVTADSRRKAALLYAKGRVLEDALGDHDKARAAYRTAAELDRQDPSILKAIEQRDRDEQKWKELERTLERGANAIQSDDRYRAALIVERARLLEHREGRVDAALELYETALRLDPHATGALEALERLCHAQRRWRELIGVLVRRAEQATDASDRAMALYRIGLLHFERLGNREEAIEALEAAVAETPDDPLVLDALSGLLERAERWERLAEVLARLTIVSNDLQDQLVLWHRVGNILDERLTRPTQAREAYERALSCDPTHVPTLQALSRLYVASEAWDPMIRMLLAEAEQAADPRRRAAAHARVAEVLEAQKQAPDEAMTHHARALSLHPGYAASFKALTRLYADAGRHRALIELYERAVEQAEEPGAAVTHLFKVGALYEDTLNEHDQAAHTYARIIELDPENLGALHALQRATERAGRYDKLVDALEREAELRQEDTHVVDLLHRAAEILDERLGDPDGAMKRYERILQIDERYEPALAGLGRIYHRGGRWDDLLELYERELALDPKGRGAAALLHKMGQLAEERIGDELRAIDCYKRALDADPRHRPSLSALQRKLTARREHQALVDVLELEVEGAPDGESRARAAYRLGQVYEEHLEAPDRAAAAFETALVAQPGFAPALDALGRLRARQGAWRRLVDQLEEEATAARDDATRVARLVRAGELWTHALDDPRRAVGCYERALQLAPGHLEALLSLEPLYRKLSRHDALAQVYGALARVLVDPGARVAALRELARIATKSDPREARSVYEAILSLSPDDPGALEALEALALSVDDRELLARIDQRLCAKAGDVKVISAYQTRLAESLEVAGDGSSIDAYRAALASDPENVAAAKGLARVALVRRDPEALVEAARREASVTPDPQRAARLLVRAGQVAQRDLRDGRAALLDFSNALELWPDDANAAAGMTELLLSAGHAARAADRLSRAAASAQSAERIAGLWMEVARLQADLLDNVPAAITSLKRVIKESPNHVPTLRTMAKLHGRQDRWPEAAEMLAKVVSLAPDRGVLRDAHLELASIWDERLDDPARALVSLQAVLSLEPDHPYALRRLAMLSARTGDLDKASHTLRRLVEVAPTPELRTQAWVMYSDIQSDRGDSEAARNAALQAIAIAGPGSLGVERHLTLIEGNADWSAHADALRAWVEHQSDPLARRTGRVEVARVLSEELARPNRAVEELELAVREQPTDVELRRLLAVNLRLSGATDDAAKQLRAVLDEHPTRAEIWRELAQTHAAANQRAAAQRALMPLLLLGEATPREKEEVSRYVARPGHAQPGSLDPATTEAFYPVRRTAELTQLMRLMVPAIGKLYPPDYEAYGVSSRARLSTRSDEPIRQTADRVAGMFGLADFHLYVHRARAKGVAVELSEPPSILIPQPIAEMAEPQRVFALAKAMANISVGLYAVDRLTPRELEIVLAATSRKVSDGYGAGLTSEDVLEDVSKRLFRALPRRNRRPAEDAARAYVSAKSIDFAHFVEAVVTSASRIALVVCDDLVAALDVLRRTERDLGELTGQKLVRHPMVSRLIRFWVSPEAEVLRSRCGLKARPPTG